MRGRVDGDCIRACLRVGKGLPHYEFDKVGCDIGDTFSLLGDVIVPLWSDERLAGHVFKEVVIALHADGRSGGGAFDQRAEADSVVEQTAGHDVERVKALGHKFADYQAFFFGKS